MGGQHSQPRVPCVAGQALLSSSRNFHVPFPLPPIADLGGNVRSYRKWEQLGLGRP